MKTPFNLYNSILSAALLLLAAGSQAQTVTYLWSNGATTPNILVNPQETTTYYLTITQDGVEYFDSLVVTVTPPPVVAINGNSTVCLGFSTTLQATPGVTYLWSTGETTASITVSPSVNTSYSVEITDANGCTGMAEINVIVNQPSAATETVSACGNYTWNGTTYTQSGNYIWTGANAAGCDSVVTLNLIVTPQPERPQIACWQTATFDTISCSWIITGTQPEAPATACYESATFNTATCSWIITGTQPEAPATACYESATFNTATCSWDVTGTQPEAPATACYESATFNTTTCSWDVSGTQPAQPTNLACWQSANFNTATCYWDITGTQPEAPVTACYESASFNTTRCSWDVTGTQPEAPATACYESASFNTTTCSWDVTGTQPAQPTNLACWQSTNFNTATCSWDITGTQPEAPVTACYESASFNTTTCSWDVTGTQPAQPTNLACWQSTNFNTATCSWDITGTQPAAIVTNATACGSYFWAVNNQQYTTSGSYSFSVNCQDYTLNLTISPNTTSTTTASACGSYTWPVNGQTYTQSGTYTFLDGCVNRTLQLTISGATTAGQISGPSNSCAHQGTSGTNATYSVQATNATSYVWTIPSGATNISGQGTANISFRYPSTFSSGTVSVVVSGCGTPITRSISVTRTAPATPGAITGLVNVCAFRGTNTPVMYSIAAVANASSYTWTLPSGVTLLTGSGTTAIQVVIGSSFCGGNIRVRANSSCGNSSIRNLALSVSTPTTPGSISGPTTACPGNMQTYSIAAVSNATSYQWTVPSGTTITAGSGTNSITLSFGSAFCGGTLSVRAVNGCGQSSTRSLSISRNTPATPSTISGPVNNLCGGGTRTYSIAAVSGATSYNWTVPAGASIVTNNGTSIMVNFSNTFTSGNITVAAVNACGAGTARSISVSRLPGRPASISGPTTVCTNQAGVMYSTPVVPGVTYTWTVPSGAVITAGQGTESITVKFGNTSGNVTVKANNSCGSSSTRSLAVCVASCRFGETEPEELTTKPNLEYGFAIYPNPGFGSVNISLPELNEEIQLRVYASNGTLIRSEQIPAGNRSWGLLLDNESDGLYLIQIETTSQLKQLRYIKQ